MNRMCILAVLVLTGCGGDRGRSDNFPWNWNAKTWDSAPDDIYARFVATEDPRYFRDLVHLGMLSDGAWSENISSHLYAIFQRMGIDWVATASGGLSDAARNQLCKFIAFESDQVTASALGKALGVDVYDATPN